MLHHSKLLITLRKALASEFPKPQVGGPPNPLLTGANKKRHNVARIASDPWKKLFENLAISNQYSAFSPSRYGYA
jgi:hypothetical protein